MEAIAMASVTGAEAKSAPLPDPLGIALSGGGFRATAFHLGVLKRLRELGVLERTRFLSTVSGGSIAGAAWVHWQALKGETLNLNNSSQWDAFEVALVDMMRRGLRGRIFWRIFWWGFVLPVVAVGVVAGLGWYLGARSWWTVGTVAGGTACTPVLAYLCWHYFATHLLEWLYDSCLFEGATVRDLIAVGARPHPHLIMNATGLGRGEHLVFTTQPLNIFGRVFELFAGLVSRTRAGSL